jgi:hypothetical protein
MNIARDETAVVVLDNGLALIAGGDNLRKGDQAEGAKLDVAMQPLTAELYNPATQRSTMLGHLRTLSAIKWAAPMGKGQALLLGSHLDMTVGSEQLGEPTAELIDTAGP